MQIETTTVDGLSIRYGRTQADGSATPLLLFNGIGASIELLVPFAEAMRKAGVSSIAFDVPGVGGSATPLVPYRLSRIARGVEHLLRDIGVSGPVDVLGVSWGGLLAQQSVHQYPARCRRLVLAATSAGAVMVPGRFGVLKNMVNPRRYTDKEFMGKVGAELYGGRFREDPGLIHEHARHLSPPTGRGYLLQMLAAAGWTSIPWLRRVKQPTLVLMGLDDPIVPVVNGRILAGLIPNSRLVTIDDGHLFLLSRIDDVVPVIRDFLDANEKAAVAD
jgi:poly(3-hydroxyalkanoate) depolymerase